MKKIFLILLTIVGFSLTFSSCKKDNVVTTPPTDNNNNSALLAKYQREGFINPDTYVILIVQPSNSTLSQSEIVAQAKRRAQSSIEKYIMSQGKRLGAQARPGILNLVNNSSELKTIPDSSQSRIVYVLEIKKSGLKYYIDSLGI